MQDWQNKKFSIKDCISASGVTGIGVRTGLHLLATDNDGQTAFNYAAGRGINYEDSFQRHRDDDPWRFMVLYEPTKAQIAKLHHGEFKGKVIIILKELILKKYNISVDILAIEIDKLLCEILEENLFKTGFFL